MSCNYKIWGRHKRKPVKLILGQTYYMRVSYYPQYIKVRLIRPTQKGFNFLNLSTHKCMLKQHLYKSKADNHQDGNLWLWINDFYQLKECNE